MRETICRRHVAEAHDRAGDQLREEGDVQGEVDRVALDLGPPAVHVDHVGQIAWNVKKEIPIGRWMPPGFGQQELAQPRGSEPLTDRPPAEDRSPRQPVGVLEEHQQARG